MYMEMMDFVWKTVRSVVQKLLAVFHKTIRIVFSFLWQYLYHEVKLSIIIFEIIDLMCESKALVGITRTSWGEPCDKVMFIFSRFHKTSYHTLL